MRIRRTFITLILYALALACPLSGGELTKIVKAQRMKNGIILLVKASNDAYDEASSTGCIVRGLETDAAKAAALRNRLLAKGIYGKVSVTTFDGKTLPCIDNLVNLVVLGDQSVQTREALRLLAPGGTALVKTKTGWETRAKPWPPEMDEWNQYLHAADNNGVARDSAGPPERLQWTAGSRFGRLKTIMPSVTSMVTANGRLFTIEDVATTEWGRLPTRYALLARDAFNGCELWRHPLKDWSKQKYLPVKNISVQLQRRLVAVGDKVYCTDGYDGPIAVFDGATGTLLSTFSGSENTCEFAYADGMVFGIQGPPFVPRVGPRRTKISQLKIGDVTLYARDAETGKVVWQAPIPGADGYTGGTLSVKGEHLCYITRTRLLCRNSRTGEQVWAREYPYFAKMPRKGVRVYWYNNSPPTIVMADERVFVCELDRVRAYSVKDGSLLWQGKTQCNYTKNGDLFYTGGLVWTGLLQGLDPATGKLVRKLEQRMTGPMSHDRCYRNRITHRYYINSKSGGADMVTLDGSGEFPSPWMRATCGLAMTPSYGRLYSSPYICNCEIGNMLLGFNCTYTQSRDKGKLMALEPQPRLLKGPAYSFAPNPRSAIVNPQSGGWPTYRHDNARSGVTRASIPKQLNIIWRASLPGQPTAPVAAAGVLLTAVRNMHTLYALDSRTGEQKWQFTTDGPIDSPPTVYGRLVLFGSRDGWVYCLDARSGALVWKFSDMPTVRLICDREQLESAWPVNGSVTVKDGLVYFAAGRSSFLDAGIVVYALNPATGAVAHRRVMAGPYDANGFPRIQRGRTFRCKGFRSGILSCQGDNLYIRHQGFKSDLTPISPYEIKTPHLMASPGFLCATPQHRTYWTIDTDLTYGPGRGYEGNGPYGDVIVVNGKSFYDVRGYAPSRHPLHGFDPRKSYRVFAGRRLPPGKRGKRIEHRKILGTPIPRARGWERWEKLWSTHIPMAGHALLLAGDVVAVAGPPMRAGFSQEDIEASYAGKKGGLLWTLSAEDGKKQGELELPAPPVWDGLAAAGGYAYLPLEDGTVLCLGGARDTALRKGHAR